jgi:hypothetical protein
MAKIVFFLIVIFIIFFPVFISNNKHKVISTKIEDKPLIEVFNGKYKKFNNKLEIEGNFKKANIYKTHSEFVNLLVNDIIKSEKYFANWALRKDNLVEAKFVKYINNDYIINSKNVVYFSKERFFKGWDFNFSSDKARGKGKYFEVDKNKNLFAKNIVYFIKVEK